VMDVAMEALIRYHLPGGGLAGPATSQEEGSLWPRRVPGHARQVGAIHKQIVQHICFLVGVVYCKRIA